MKSVADRGAERNACPCDPVLKANASTHHRLNKLSEEVEALLQQAEAADRADVPDGMSIPEELAQRKDRLEAIVKAKEEIERRAAERHARETQAYEQKDTERKKSGRGLSGRSLGVRMPMSPRLVLSGLKDHRT